MCYLHIKNRQRRRVFDVISGKTDAKRTGLKKTLPASRLSLILLASTHTPRKVAQTNLISLPIHKRDESSGITEEVFVCNFSRERFDKSRTSVYAIYMYMTMQSRENNGTVNRSLNSCVVYPAGSTCKTFAINKYPVAVGKITM